MSNFNWKKYAEMIYGIGANRSKELLNKMLEKFPKGGSVYLDDYTSEEIVAAKKKYYKITKEKKIKNEN